ncbi:uncharacterized protein BXZ73DRAFT_100567 [Epithele typhae]|uniref:uncharacterized protein n=1 Tax=Epithele typhae TaxID=378194 RepID=UPI0020081A11|nr:uncharacterized protein BXZ73DRAFT_100567 [Epithele typhae]KAH9935180.1 hypothetical protein BXZ73DRAFT_100567 [Epithele typhae]
MFSIVLITVALVAAACANPLPASEVSVHPLASASGVTTAASFPLHDLASSLGPVPASAAVGTTPAPFFAKSPSADAVEATFPATLLLCPGTNCASCSGFDLSRIPVNVCFATSAFRSVAISQPSNSGLPFGVVVGPSGCSSFAQIPTVNQCFNVNGGPFSDFALIQ